MRVHVKKKLENLRYRFKLIYFMKVFSSRRKLVENFEVSINFLRWFSVVDSKSEYQKVFFFHGCVVYVLIWIWYMNVPVGDGDDIYLTYTYHTYTTRE